MRTVGPYELVRLLGRGGMGEVHLARDTRRGRDVALKMLDPRLLDEPENYVERFRREGELLRSIHHRSLPDIHEVGVSEAGEAYLAMEYLSGKPLSDWIGRSPLETIPLLIQICGALGAIAGRGIVHRDLSPDNILVVARGRHTLAKIIDFGIAKEVGRTTKLTETGYFFGKVQYCSPEQVGQLAEGETIDWRSDLYSLGIIVYNLFSGVLPFRGDTPVAYMSAHLHEKPKPLKTPAGRPTYPRRLEDLVARMLEKDRNRRPASYDDVVRALALSHAEILLRSGWSASSAAAADRQTASTHRLPDPKLSQAETVGDPKLSQAETLDDPLRTEPRPPEKPED